MSQQNNHRHNTPTSVYQLCNDDLARFGIPTGAKVIVAHTQSIPFGSLACVKAKGQRFIGEYLPQPCGCLLVKLSDRIVRLAPKSFVKVGIVAKLGCMIGGMLS